MTSASAGPARTGTGSRPAAGRYLDALGAALERARERNKRALAEAAALVERVVAGDGIVYVYGSGHSQLAALELNRRAGSIAPLQVIFDPGWGAAEHVEGYAAALLSGYAFGPTDCLVVVSHSGNTAAGIELAQAARAAGVPVIGVTSPEASRAARVRHSSGRRLAELADVVLDNGTAERDPAIRVAGLGAAVGPTSTLVAAALLHEIVTAAVARLAERGLEAPILRANSEPGGREHNERLAARYRCRLRMVP